MIERRAESTAIVEALGSTDGPRGVLLNGLPGTGKSTLIGASVASLNRPVRWMAGTTATKQTPFAVLDRRVDIASPWNLAAMLSASGKALAQEVLSGTIVVDDAHLLDPSSATLLNQLATDGAVSLAVTVRTGEPAPDAITALWKDRGFARLTLGCFDRGETDTILTAALGGPVESTTSERIWTTTQGNPLYLRHLVEGSLAAGSLRCSDGIWYLNGEPAITLELGLGLHHQCARAPLAARRVLALVAFGEPLDLAVLGELAGQDSMLAAERFGLVRFGREGSTLMARLAHPFLGEVVRKSVDTAEARRIRGELATRLGVDATGPIERIRAAELFLDSDRHASTPSLTAAAVDATALCYFDSAEALARAAAAGGGGFQAQLIRAGALAWTDRGNEAERILSALDTTGRGESDLVRWAALRAGNLFWNLDAHDLAVDVLGQAHAHVTTPAGIDCLDAARAAIDVSLGHATAAAKVAGRIRDSATATPAARMWAASAGCLALSLVGRGYEVAPWARQALGSAESDTSVLRFAVGHGEMLALIYTGQLRQAERSARQYLELARNHDVAWFGMSSLFGKLELAMGRLDEARNRLEAVTATPGRSTPEWRVLANLLLAQSLTLSGRKTDGIAAVQRAEASFGENTLLYKPDLGITRAWISAGSGDLGTAIGLARRAADAAGESGLLAVAAEAMHTAVRFGDRSAASGLTSLSNVVDGYLIAPMAAQAVAMTAADCNGLLSAAARFDQLGARLLAADAYSQAANSYRRVGDRRSQLRTSARAYALARQCGGARTPAIAAAAQPLPLTTREHEVAVLAATELTNHEIADRLAVSTRTVEGHLYRTFMKLDVSDRAELTETIRMEDCR